MATSPKPRRNLADYDRPPLTEVAFGIQFEPLKGWLIPHTGQFWDRVSDSFPRCEHAPPIGDPLPIDITGFPLPRIWLINNSDDQLIQLQPGRFLFNWRHRGNVGKYPRYDELSKSFFSLLSKFSEFCDEKEFGRINILQNELTYINTLEEDEKLEFTRDNAKILKYPVWNEKNHDFLTAPSSMNWQATFQLPDKNGTLTVRANQQKRLDENTQHYLLELSARGISPTQPLDNIEDWYSLAHEWIVLGFEDITVTEAQKERWGKL